MQLDSAMLSVKGKETRRAVEREGGKEGGSRKRRGKAR